jgi:nitric oxide reductase subunit B
MFGVFGMLALGVLAFCLRELQDDASWKTTERLLRVGYWGLNAGLSLMIVLDLFPAGVLQLRDVIANGYWHARRLTYSMSGLFHVLEWVRVVGDGTFLALGALPIAVAALLAFVRQGRRAPGS